MVKKIKICELSEFDMAEYLTDEEAMADYLSIVMEENDAAALADALGTVARACGMTEIAKASGITREALYHALRPNAQPRFETIRRVCDALGLKLSITPKTPLQVA
jgi:probable addiction module antidote protein